MLNYFYLLLLANEIKCLWVMKMSIGEKIVELRKKYHFTQEKLAEKIGVSRQTLSNWESNVTSPDLSQAKILCQYLKTSLDELANSDLEIICDDNSKDNIFNNLVGKKCYFSFDDDFYDMYLNYDTLVQVLGVNSDFIKIEYLKGKEKCIKLIDLELIVAIRVIEEG